MNPVFSHGTNWANAKAAFSPQKTAACWKGKDWVEAP
jgi:hypothetical protein